MVGEPPVMQQMVEQFASGGASILAVQEVPAEHTRRYGIVAGTQGQRPRDGRDAHRREAGAEDAPSRLGVAGRYILTPGVSTRSRRSARRRRRDQLTDGIAGLLRREKVFAYRYQGKRYDCGSKEGFLQANVELALQHPELGKSFQQFLKNLEI
jgi:UTP--glucose-1-phosphate uridylyltransferase